MTAFFSCLLKMLFFFFFLSKNFFWNFFVFVFAVYNFMNNNDSVLVCNVFCVPFRFPINVLTFLKHLGFVIYLLSHTSLASPVL